MGKKLMIEREIVNDGWKDGEIPRWKELGCIRGSSVDASTVAERASWK